MENITQSGVNISNILLRDVCLYIHDMRILNNIFNEFYIYSDVLSEQTRHDKLFSLIVYKNMYPDDFALLHKNEGIVYQVFSTAKDEIISALNSAYLNKCLEIEKEIQSINNENIKDIETLTLIYSAAIFRKIDKALFIEIQNKKKRLVDITLGDLKWVRNQTDLYYYIEAGSNYGSATTRMLASISFSDIELQVDESQTLLSREQNILGKSESYINGKKYEAATLKKDLDKIKNKCLKDLLELNESSSLILLDFVIEKRLLFYLIRNRYIDETYSSTISNFYEGQFTLKDKSFLLSIKDRIPTDITLKLYKIDAIVEQLTDDDYSREAILNYSFVEYISNLEDFLPIRHKNIVEILSKQDKRSLDFLRGYLENVINKEKFIAHICKYWPSFVKFLIDSSSYTKQTIQEWVILIIKGADVKDIERQNEDSKLSNWISKSGDFLQHFNGENEVNRMHSIILRLGVKFEKLELTESIKAQLNFVYEKCLYKLNQYMIEQIVTNKNSISILHYDLSLANYTSIQSTNCEILKAYIADNIEEYLNCVFLQIDENTEESEETIIKLLSIQNDIEPETKQKIIAKENVKISNVASVDSVFWNELFNTSKVAPTWGNILKYYEEFNGVDESLANFLNKSNNYTILIKEKPDSSFIDLYKDVIVCPYISEDALRYYATFINHTFSSLVFGKLSEQKIDILLECNIIECNEDNFFELKDKFKDRQILLLEKNIGDFLRKHSVYDIDAHDYSLLLKSTILTVEDKRSLIELIDIDIFGKSPELAHILSDFLIRHGCNEIDSDVLKLIFPLIETQDRKVSLLISQIEKLSNEGILDILSNIGEPYSDLCRKGLHAKLPLSDTNGKLLVNLEIRDIISSFRQERDEFRIYLKRKK